MIYGAGTMGLLMAQLIRMAGAGSVSVVDIKAERLELAGSLAADQVSTSADEIELPNGWDVVIDCTGAIAAIEDGLTRVRRGGTFQQFGVAAAMISHHVALSDYGSAIDLFRSGAGRKIQVMPTSADRLSKA